MAKYNGHDSWNAWNVSLWLANDEGLYNLVRETMRRTKNKDRAAANLASILAGEATPDGAPYTKTNIRKALIGL